MDTRTALPREDYMRLQIVEILESNTIRQNCCKELATHSPTNDQVVQFGVTHGFSEEFSKKFYAV